MNLDKHEWSHPVWWELQLAFRHLYRDKVFYNHAESIFRQKAYDCNRRSTNGKVRWQELKWLYEYVNGLCFWNEKKVPQYLIRLKLDFEPDHYIPLNRGGANTIDNIVLCTRNMNRRKGGKYPVNFQLELGGIDFELSKALRLSRKHSDLIHHIVMKQRQITLDSLHKRGVPNLLDE